jgi:hypothetical protein
MILLGFMAITAVGVLFTAVYDRIEAAALGVAAVRPVRRALTAPIVTVRAGYGHAPSQVVVRRAA